jgi:hypothetical protein
MVKVGTSCAKGELNKTEKSDRTAVHIKRHGKDPPRSRAIPQWPNGKEP